VRSAEGLNLIPRSTGICKRISVGNQREKVGLGSRLRRKRPLLHPSDLRDLEFDIKLQGVERKSRGGVTRWIGACQDREGIAD
jgi:hypothetical protein